MSIFLCEHNSLIKRMKQVTAQDIVSGNPKVHCSKKFVLMFVTTVSQEIPLLRLEGKLL